MPVTKHLLIRLITIDRCLQNRVRKWTLDDLVKACNEALRHHEGTTGTLCRRTLQYDIQLMRSNKLGLNAPIVVTEKKYYCYGRPNYSIYRLPFSKENLDLLTETLKLLNKSAIFPQLNLISDMLQQLAGYTSYTPEKETPVIYPDNYIRMPDPQLIKTLYQHIIDKKSVCIRYVSFRSSVMHHIVISPYLLKEYGNHWFVTGYDHRNKTVQTWSTNRISTLFPDTGQPYVENTFFDPKHYFDAVIGVSRTLYQKKQAVIIQIDRETAPYILCKPLHQSQKTLQEHKGAIVISLHVCLNLELEREILKLGQHAKVLHPRLLKSRIARHFREAAQRYRTFETDDSGTNSQNLHNFNFNKP